MVACSNRARPVLWGYSLCNEWILGVQKKDQIGESDLFVRINNGRDFNEKESVGVLTMP